MLPFYLSSWFTNDLLTYIPLINQMHKIFPQIRAQNVTTILSTRLLSLCHQHFGVAQSIILPSKIFTVCSQDVGLLVVPEVSKSGIPWCTRLLLSLSFRSHSCLIIEACYYLPPESLRFLGLWLVKLLDVVIFLSFYSCCFYSCCASVHVPLYPPFSVSPSLRSVCVSPTLKPTGQRRWLPT